MAADEQKPLGSGFAPKSEPHQILQDLELSGQTAIVTGGYSGIGLETTKALAARGVTVVVPARTRRKAEENLSNLAGDILIADMDLGDPASVARFADHAVQTLDKVDLLINNAGIMACPETRVGPGWEAQFGTNHMGHFILTNGLLPLLIKADGARVVQLSSIAHRRCGIQWDDIQFDATPYHKWAAYAQSKSANALFAVELDRRYKKDGVRAFSVHPGGILTPLQRHLPVEEMMELGWVDETGQVSEQAAAIFKSPSQGCTTSLWAATSPQLAGKGGLYCEDCDVAQLMDETSPPYFHVAPHAIDAESATRLWDVSMGLLE